MPDSKLWNPASFVDILDAVERLKYINRLSSRSDLIDYIQEGAQAGTQANAGQQAWIARERSDRVHFAYGQRFVPEEDWEYDLEGMILDHWDELVPDFIDGSLQLHPSVTAEIIEGLKRADLVEWGIGFPLAYDSFAHYLEFEGVIVETLDTFDWESLRGKV